MKKLDDGTAVYLTVGGGLYRSIDNGGTWTSIGTELGGTIEAMETRDNELFVANGPGAIFRSTNQGDTWTTLREAGQYT